MSIKGKTKSGFEYVISDSSLDNMEVLDALEELGENPLAPSKALRLLLGDEQRKKLYDMHREEGGRVPTAAILSELEEILANSSDENDKEDKELKNS